MKQRIVMPDYDDDLVAEVAREIERGVESEENYHQVAWRIIEKFSIRRKP